MVLENGFGGGSRFDTLRKFSQVHFYFRPILFFALGAAIYVVGPSYFRKS